MVELIRFGDWLDILGVKEKELRMIQRFLVQVKCVMEIIDLREGEYEMFLGKEDGGKFDCNIFVVKQVKCFIYSYKIEVGILSRGGGWKYIFGSYGNSYWEYNRVCCYLCEYVEGKEKRVDEIFLGNVKEEGNQLVREKDKWLVGQEENYQKIVLWNLQEERFLRKGVYLKV